MKLPKVDCVVKVGEGRGFIVEQRVRVHRPNDLPTHIKLRRFRQERWVITAGHCLPRLPRPIAHSWGDHSTTFLDGTTMFKKLFGPLGGATELDAECTFVDPVADIAVLKGPDDQVYFEEAEAYDAFVERAPALRIAQPQSGPGWMLSLANEWVPIRLNVDVHSDGVGLEIDPTEAGQSGSPILDAKGRAVGVIVVGTETTRKGVKKKTRCSQPILTRDLPVRLLR